MLNPVEWLVKAITDLASECANAAFSWLQIYMIEPVDFSKYGFIGDLFNTVFTLSVTAGGLFFVYNLIKIIVQQAGGYSSRSTSEVVVKAILGTVLGVLCPFLMKDVLITISNAIVQMFVSKGVTVTALTGMVALTDPTGASLGVALGVLFLALLFLILAIQYIMRLGEIMVLFAYSPICAMSSMNEDMNAWSIWWREAFATVFTQPFQISILWVIINQITTGMQFKDIILSIGLMIIVLKGPGFLRKFLYSSGAGRTIVSAAGGAGKMAILRFAAGKVIGK
jgi:hypothetical protein